MLFSNVFTVYRKRFAGKVINSAAHDSIKSDALNEFAFYMFDYNVDSSVLLAKQAEEKAVKAGNVRQQARAFKNCGISYDIKGKTDSALLFFDKALALAKHQLHPTIANIITDVANAYYAAGNYELAASSFEACTSRRL
jgi:tetratricopeptide (TPR) repeat protein